MKDELDELSPLAQELIQSGKGAHDPTPADQDRVLAALQPRIAAGEGVEPPPDASVPPPAPPPAWPLISAGGIGAALVAAALVWGLAPEPAPGPPAAPRTILAPVEPVSPPSSTEAREVEPSAPPPAPAERAPAAPKVKSSLAEEVALLSRATTALHAGRAEEALAAAAEHQQKFPRGLLTEERRSVRAQALCVLGRTAEAKRELDRLSASSPQAARARQRCGLE